MCNKIVKTGDNSFTLYNTRLNEHYHSTFGAIQESEHVFIKSGLELFRMTDSPINIFEVGFGTGLNALLSYKWAEKYSKQINYQCIELYPIELETAVKLNYADLLNLDQNIFLKMHQVIEKEMPVSAYFSLHKYYGSLQEFKVRDNQFNLIYFDAFSPDVQPEMWSEKVFQKIFKAMKRGGVLTSYSCKGIVKRALKSTGFKVEKLPGPKGKREILRAHKN